MIPRITAHITLARVVMWIAMMLILILADSQLFGTYDYYISVTSLGRFVLATLISTCAVMLYERSLNS